MLQKCGFVLEGVLRRYAHFPNLAPGVGLDSLSFSRVFSRDEQAGVPPPLHRSAGVVVRPARSSDAAAWVAMREALWPDESGAHAAEVEQFFAATVREPVEVLIAVDAAGRAVGFAELSIRPYAEDCETDRVAYLEGWYVTPDARRRGVGRALIEAAEAWARGQGCTEFGSDALLENESSAAAHRALGFQETVQIRCFRKTLE